MYYTRSEHYSPRLCFHLWTPMLCLRLHESSVTCLKIDQWAVFAEVRLCCMCVLMGQKAILLVEEIIRGVRNSVSAEVTTVMLQTFGWNSCRVEIVLILCICFSSFLMTFCEVVCVVLKVLGRKLLCEVLLKSPLRGVFCLFVWCSLF